MKSGIAFLAFYVVFVFAAFSQDNLRLRKDNIDEVISAMTLEEKVHLCIGTGMSGTVGDVPVVGSTDYLLPGTAGTTYPITRLGIPAIVLSDGPMGLRIDPIRDFDSKTYYCTHFPIGTALAATWNQDLIYQVGAAIGQEVLEYGSDMLLAPAINIHRHPLCGRNFEYYSEDPILTGMIAKNFVLGLQNEGVAATVKHFAVNNQETNRVNSDSRLSQRALREIYLKAFEIVVKQAKPKAIMSSYNKINGVYASESPDLLTTILRDEWGFDGIVMTDWFAPDDPILQIKAGNDMLQPGTDKQFAKIVTAVKSGLLDEKIIDRSVKRVLNAIVESPRFNNYAFSNKPDLLAHADVSRNAAAESVVLLKNNATLPLLSSKNIVLYGVSSYDIIAGGTGSGNVNRAYTVSLVEGLRNAGFFIDDSVLKTYKNYLKSSKNETSDIVDYSEKAMENQLRIAEILPSEMDLQSASVRNDVAIITLGRISGEFQDIPFSDFALTQKEDSLIRQVASAFHAQNKKVIVVLNVGGAIETFSWKDVPDAILCAWQGGQECGNSIADVLSGKINPSGNLPISLPISISDVAATPNFPIEAPVIEFSRSADTSELERKNIDYSNYEEDVFVGYRYFCSFNKKVSYPFGFGLSYTDFAFENSKVEVLGDSCFVSVDVKNVGDCSGKKVVQLYVAAPDGKLKKTSCELKSFAKTSCLKPGEKQKLFMKLAINDLASFDEKSDSWIVEQGTYYFCFANSCTDFFEKIPIKFKGKKIKVNDCLKPIVKLNLIHKS